MYLKVYFKHVSHVGTFKDLLSILCLFLYLVLPLLNLTFLIQHDKEMSKELPVDTSSGHYYSTEVLIVAT